MAKPPPPLFSMKGSMTAVHSLAYKLEEDESLLFAGTQTGNVHVWDLKINREQSQFSAGEDPILSMFYINKLLILQDKSGSINVWEQSESTWILKKALPQDHISFCKSVVGFHNGELVLACAHENSVIRVISLQSYELLFSLSQSYCEEKLGTTMALRFFEFNEKLFLLAIYENLSLILWDVNNKKPISKLKISEECPMAIDFDPKTMRGICGSANEFIIVFKIDKDQNLVKKSEFKIISPGVSSIKIRPDGKLVAIGCWDGMIRIYSWRSLKMLASLDYHNGSIHDICFSHQPVPSWKTSILMAVGGKDARISLWNLFN